MVEIIWRRAAPQPARPRSRSVSLSLILIVCLFVCLIVVCWKPTILTS